MLNEHELRREIVGEMHLRRWPLLASRMQVGQILNIVDPMERDIEWTKLESFSGELSRSLIKGARHVSGEFANGVTFIWERHSEASSIALFAPLTAISAMTEALAWAEEMPGKTIRATKIAIVDDEVAAEAVLPELCFEAAELVSCHLAGGARIWSDFRIGADSYGHIVIAVNGLDRGDLTRAVQQVQEIGNYRNLALLGLPVARRCWPALDRAESRLRALGEELVEGDTGDDELLAKLCDLSLEIGAIASGANYRMSATAAYMQLVDERLTDLAPVPITGFLPLADFTQRRLLPAVRTCAAVTLREQQVSNRAAQFTSLLRTRIDTRIENQNVKLLASLERSATTQLRLQHLVESFSVVAISYYTVSLVAHLLEGIEPLIPGLPVHGIVAVLIPAIVVALLFGLRHARKHLLSGS